MDKSSQNKRRLTSRVKTESGEIAKDSRVAMKLFCDELQRLAEWPEWRDFTMSGEKLSLVMSRRIPFDPRFNAAVWMRDVVILCRETAYGVCMMKSRAQLYCAQKQPGDLPAHVDFHVTYFASNNMLRLFAARDKLALAVWAYYCSFDPDEKQQVLDHKNVLRRLQRPEQHGLKLDSPKPFLALLANLDGGEYVEVERYRHLAVHRREPRIEIFGVQSHHDVSYLVPLYSEEKIKTFEASLRKDNAAPEQYALALERCKINGRIYEQRKLSKRLWSYACVERTCEMALKQLLAATAGCTNELLAREPLKSSVASKCSPTELLKIMAGRSRPKGKATP